MSDDGAGAIAIGWALWGSTGLHRLQAWDFIADGYRAWQQSPSYDREVALALMEATLARLIPLPAAPWPDVYAYPPEEVTPVAVAHSAACWTATELVDLAPGRYDDDAYKVIASARVDFVPPRSLEFARAHSAARGLTTPW